MKKFHINLIFLLLIALTFTHCKNEKKGTNHGSMLPRGQVEHLDRFEQEIQAFEAADKSKMPPKGAILFVGSSSIRLWSTLENDFTPMPVINRGFGGSTIGEVNYYAERIVHKYAPSMIVFYCGENDIMEEKAPAIVFQDFKKFIGETEKNLGKIPVVYISAKPSPARWDNWRKFQTLNNMIETFAEARDNFTFIDISNLLIGSDGKPDPTLFVKDQLHLNEMGYAKWVEVIRPEVEELYLESVEQ